jgi:PAS domain S-box-containing protein
MKTVDLMHILGSISDAVVRLDGQGRYLSMNQAAEKMFIRLGRDPITMMGHSIWELFPDLKDTESEKQLRRVLQDEQTVEYEFYEAANQRWYETRGFPSVPGAILIVRDITDRKVC